jgi:predicted MFS family arabinose efflux permease
LPTLDGMTTYREVLAQRPFRVLFVCRSLSISAETLRIVALSVLVYSTTGSPLLGALAFGVGFLPQAIGGTLLGAVADRISPRRLIAAGYVLEALVAAALAMLELPVGWSLALVGAVACLVPVLHGAAGRVMADVLTGDAYVLGRALTGMSSSAAQLLGLAGGGVAVAALGPRQALLVTAAVHLVAAVWLRIGLPASPAAPAGAAGAAGGSGFGSTLRAGWTGAGRLLGDPTVRRLMLAQWLPPALMVGGEALLIPYASGRGFSASAAGAMLAALPVGMIVGDFAVGRFAGPVRREALVLPLGVLLGAPLPVLLAGPPLPVVVALLAIGGVGFAYSLGLQRLFLDAVPEEARGQAFALLSTGLMTLQGLGPLAFGALAEWTGPPVAIAIAGGLTMAVAPWLLSRRVIRGRGVRPLGEVASQG